MKKIFAILLSGLLLISLAACNGGNIPAENSGTSSSVSTQNPLGEPVEEEIQSTPTGIQDGTDVNQIGKFDLERGIVPLNSGYEMPTFPLLEPGPWTDGGAGVVRYRGHPKSENTRQEYGVVPAM